MPDRDDQNRIDDDQIIDEPVSVDATGIDLLGTPTAQVAVTLPVVDEEDFSDEVDDDDYVSEPVSLATRFHVADVSADVPASSADVREATAAVHVVDDADADADAGGAEGEGTPDADDAPASYEEEPAVEVDDTAGDPDPDPQRVAPRPAVEAPAPPAPATGVDAPTPVTLSARRVDGRDAERETAELLTADRLLRTDRLPRREPRGAWPHLVYTLTGGRVQLADSRRIREREALHARITAPLTGGARFTAVLSRKGGVGKTTVTALLGMALADARDDRVIALDANPDRGTLAERIGRPSGKTMRDLTGSRTRVHGFSEISSVVARDDTRLDVIASDSDPHVSVAFDASDYRDVAALAAHYYSIVLTDTGTGIVHSVMSATLEASDSLVIVAGLSVDEARLASETLTWLETNGYAELARSAVVVLNASRPGTPLVRPGELEEHFRSRVRAVVHLPYDARIAAGAAISFRDLQPATRAAARELAAVVVAGLGPGHTAGAA